MGISSPGIGSGLDVNSIVTQLVAIEKQPLNALKTKASGLQSQVSTYAAIKSQVSALGDAATALSTASAWGVFQATSTNSAAATITTTSSATATSLSLEISALARAQTAASRYISTDGSLGVAGETGTLSISIGSWATGSFVAGSALPVSVDIKGDDKLSTVASKINAAATGVTATVMRTGTQERLVLRSSSTGEEAGFSVSASGFSGLDSLSFNALNNPSGSTAGMELGQTGLNASAKINGLDIESATNTLTDVTPGVTIALNQVTTSPVEITVSQDLDALQKKIQTFADAYTALNKTITEALRYVQGGVSGPLQGDSTTMGLQRVLSNVLASGSTGSSFSHLSDIGLQRQKDGSLKLDTAKLTTAMKDLPNVQKLFTQNNGSQTTNGFGLKFKDFASGLIASTGTITTKTAALQGSMTRNSDEQDKVNARASRIETQLRKQYSDLDSRLVNLQGLNSYVTAQLAQWNKAS